jgi:Immunity protein Imm1
LAHPFVRTLNAPRWRGSGYKEHAKEEPPWNEVEEAVRALNADDLNDVYLEGPADARMVIGGGAGRYVISVDVPDSQVGVKHFSAVNTDSDPNEWIDLVVAGSLGDWPASEIIDLDLALAAARTYYHDGALAPTVQWRRV